MSYSYHRRREFSFPLRICAYEHCDESAVPSLDRGKTHSHFAIFRFIIMILKLTVIIVETYLPAFTIVQVQACGSLVTEEQPQSMIVPIELFLMFYSFYKRPLSHSSPTSPLSPPCVPPELLSSESLGLKLKPIKTRVAVQA